MIKLTQGNLLEADADAIVNTVNTVGVMGKGIALMFKEKFPENYKAYAAACKREEVKTGRMFVTASGELSGPRWIINFPTKQHWRNPSKLEWIIDGLKDLKRVIHEKNIGTIAIPPLGSGNGGLDWERVKSLIIESMADMPDVEVVIYEPTARYQNVAKGSGVETLTPARALIAEMIRRYGVLGLECSILEVQKLAWVLGRVMDRSGLNNPLKLTFVADRYGPYASQLTHLLNALDGSYLHCDKRLADASPFDTIRFDDDKKPALSAYFCTPQAADFVDTINQTDQLIDGFQSPLGMEALSTVDWLLIRENAEPTINGIRQAIDGWPGDGSASARKQKLFSDKLLQAAINRLNPFIFTSQATD